MFYFSSCIFSPFSSPPISLPAAAQISPSPSGWQLTSSTNCPPSLSIQDHCGPSPDSKVYPVDTDDEEGAGGPAAGGV
ncbi:unnamed protein product [Linum trigynum]|uniref:Uncharacterized protein n=1 Tax=Linum trigynum TaxID=586398 RepID=A0AAV2EGB6_9ROSI